MRKTTALIFAAVLVLVMAQPVSANNNIDGWTNGLRERNGLPELNTSYQLTEIARERAREIVDDGFFHDFSWASQLKRENLCGVGENIAMRRPAPEEWSARWLFEAWRDSPGHRENMLGGWTGTGSAFYIAPDGSLWGVQLFQLRDERC